MRFMQLRRRRRARLMAWLELVRLPNLFTAPGDFLGGAALTAVLSGRHPSLLAMLAGSLGAVLFYASGIVYNDFCDQSEDRFRRPERPLPSRRIAPGEALAGAGVCLLGGLLAFALCGRRPFLCAVVLAIVVWAYDAALKRRIESGVVAMGLCRGLSFLTGCSAVGWHPGVLPVFLATAVYVSVLTWLADGEERHQIPDRVVFYPAGVLAIGWILAFPFLMFAPAIPSRMLGWSALALLAACGGVVVSAGRIYNRSVSAPEMRRYIGHLLLALMPWQASWVFLAGGRWPTAARAAGICLLVVLPLLAGCLGRRFRQD